MPLVERLSRNQLRTQLPPELVLEATWNVLMQEGIKEAAVDVREQVLTGYSPANFWSHGFRVKISYQFQTDGVLLTVGTSAIVPGSAGGIRLKRYASQLADAIANTLESGWPPTEVTLPGHALHAPTPIALPTGEVHKRTYFGPPRYGKAAPVPQGVQVLGQSLLFFCCCQLLSPLAMQYGFRVLKEYGSEPVGDRPLVVVGTILGVVGTMILLGIFILFLIGIVAG